jgi:hypothetical protein
MQVLDNGNRLVLALSCSLGQVVAGNFAALRIAGAYQEY